MDDEIVTEQIHNLQLPAIQTEQLPRAPTLFAADSIHMPMATAAYERIGQLALTLEEKQELLRPVPDDEVEIRTDGTVYISHEYLRRRLCEIFGPMQWTLVPGSPLAQRPNSEPPEYFQRWALFIRGIYCSEALSSCILYERKQKEDNDNSQSSAMTLDQIAETIKSDCVRRTTKDLGLGLEAWNRAWRERWKRDNAILVKVQTWKGIKDWWRRKDAGPLTDRYGKVIEITGQSRNISQGKVTTVLDKKVPIPTLSEGQASILSELFAEHKNITDSGKLLDEALEFWKITDLIHLQQRIYPKAVDWLNSKIADAKQAKANGSAMREPGEEG